MFRNSRNLLTNLLAFAIVAGLLAICVLEASAQKWQRHSPISPPPSGSMVHL